MLGDDNDPYPLTLEEERLGLNPRLDDGHRTWVWGPTWTDMWKRREERLQSRLGRIIPHPSYEQMLDPKYTTVQG